MPDRTLVSILAIALCGFWFGFMTGREHAAGPRTVTVTVCEHGESSVGPVTVKNGRLTGSTTPHLTGCS